MKEQSETDKLWRPCRFCKPPERTPTCHATCEKYRKAQELQAEAKAKEKKYAHADDFKANGIQRVRRKCYNDKFRKG